MMNNNGPLIKEIENEAQLTHTCLGSAKQASTLAYIFFYIKLMMGFKFDFKFLAPKCFNSQNSRNFGFTLF